MRPRKVVLVATGNAERDAELGIVLESWHYKPVIRCASTGVLRDRQGKLQSDCLGIDALLLHATDSAVFDMPLVLDHPHASVVKIWPPSSFVKLTHREIPDNPAGRLELREALRVAVTRKRGPKPGSILNYQRRRALGAAA